MVEDVVTKPESRAPFNYGPISGRDEIVYTCERPGGNKKNDAPGATPQDEIDEWFTFMKDHDVKRVMCLLDDNELAFYTSSLFDMYKENGMICTHVPMKSENARDNVFKAMTDAENAGEKIVIHCTGGKGRSARAATSWLVTKYGLSASDATDEAIQAAREKDVIRLGNYEKLEKWMK
uniref:Tyrosine specific protein phosphatases domain-containing protein n=1 Tax=Rhodosorus marinus TaxID=101924 RepID=A0A6T6M269_9RHOD|mmetsp:Transcript_22739/g.32735  ORF Transcript_22739/g.32735 Transcript_22739/m.32735 type:complete len:178 (+) Transcript_22739:169-702(+)